MKTPLYRIAMLSMALVFAACAQPADDPAAPSDPTPPAEATAPQDTSATASSPVYETVGVVTTIMANRKFVVIDHEDIPGYMDGMSMPFPVPDSTILRGIHPGDSITFRFTPTEGIQAIEKKER